MVPLHSDSLPASFTILPLTACIVAFLPVMVYAGDEQIILHAGDF